MSERLILADMNADALLDLNNALDPKLTKYVPSDHDPTINSKYYNPKLHAFLLLNNLETFYGEQLEGQKHNHLKVQSKLLLVHNKWGL